ncbi:MAG: hypothetical protein A2W90_22485 [Bacteroidetes bacterium GWF2_42_66]|nr:MAG: hypothetical protein A2W92_21890 [Bacteroidetes bacterium GWA2_42_15]OFY03100.1 MAG: hypothetical protein A2W89_13265 [Bacteroidetes bacterium GWE2_42_39]OFY45208.1 MAG: hypothetical protein A2W90_22485 [Bacteroidetes bacterium GWF2_42_66]HBL74135.1 hypothetical protein [Prolixibacteraceae bacterium]HCR90590.1 hypothetical protein [Prolixibacteraceae bacterium]
MKETHQIPDFVFSCLRKTATEQETFLLNEWLIEADNADLYRQLQKIDQISSDLHLYRSFDLASGRREVRKGIRSAKQASLFLRMQRVAAILFLPLILTSLFVVYQNKMLKDDLRVSAVLQQIDAQPGTKTHFFLPDSTEVWLNSASTIKFPSVFSGTIRLVELDGEAYFKVYKNKRKPFVVKNGSFEVEALGTAFNLCAYSEDNKFTATLEEGKIKVNERTVNKSLVISPGEQVRFSIQEKQLNKSDVDVQDIIAWKDGRLVFDQTPFSDVVLALGRWFNADIQLTDQSIANYRYTGTFTDESLSQVMELLKLTAPIDYSADKRSITEGNNFTKERIQIRKN